MTKEQMLLSRVARQAEDLLQELDEYDFPQFDKNEEFGPDTAVGGLRIALTALREAGVPVDWTLEEDAVARHYGIERS